MTLFGTFRKGRPMASELAEYIGKQVVIDSNSHYLYIGILSEEGEEFITLKDVDVHDRRESSTAKDLYIIEALKYGTKINRHTVKVVRREIVSISLLSDVVEY